MKTPQRLCLPRELGTDRGETPDKVFGKNVPPKVRNEQDAK
jgi:hypothetical protein